MNYCAEIAAARRKRDKRIDHATVEWRESTARMRAERDREIRLLRTQGLATYTIGLRVRCSPSQVYEVLHPERHVAYDARRREHYHRLRAVACRRDGCARRARR